MFDSVPPNLPVEPAPTAPASAPVPAIPAPVTPIMKSPSGKKEPEDIFSDLEQPTASVAGATPEAQEAPRHGSKIRMVLIVIVSFVVLAGIGGAAWFVFFSTSEVKVSAPAVPSVIVPTAPTTSAAPEKVEQPPVEIPAEPVTQPPAGVNIPAPEAVTPSTGNEANPFNGTVSSSAVASSTAEVAPVPPTAVQSPTEGVDTDADHLTDVEEPFYQADPAKADTNGNGYPDGTEVMNLYSPVNNGKKLADEPFIQKVVWDGWSFLLPKPWTVAADPNNPAVGVVTTGGATRFTLETKSNPGKLSLMAWVGSDVASGQLHSFKTKSGLDALQMADGLTTYLASGDTVLVVTYDLNGDPSYDYRTSYAMVINALVPPGQK